MGRVIKTELFFSLPSYYHQQYYTSVGASKSIVRTNVETLRSDDDDGNENVKKNNRFKNQNNNVALASCFFVHCFAVTARLRREYA